MQCKTLKKSSLVSWNILQWDLQILTVYHMEMNLTKGNVGRLSLTFRLFQSTTKESESIFYTTENHLGIIIYFIIHKQNTIFCIMANSGWIRSFRVAYHSLTVFIFWTEATYLNSKFWTIVFKLDPKKLLMSVLGEWPCKTFHDLSYNNLFPTNNSQIIKYPYYFVEVT